MYYKKLWTEYFLFSFFLVFFLLIKIICIQMMHLFERVKSIHKT